jgi:hypothetical protein
MSRDLRASSAAVRTVHALILACRVLLRLLHPLLSFAFHHHLHCAHLLHALFLAADKFIDQEVFADHYALLIDNVIELAFFLFDYVFLFLLFFIIIVIILFVIEILLRLLLLIAALRVELIEYVLYLSLELLIALVHQVLQDVLHPQLLGLLPQTFPGEDRIQGSVHIGAHLQVVMLHQIVKDF